MPAHAKDRSMLARQLMLIVLLCLSLVLAGAGGLAWYLYQMIDTTLSRQPAGARAWMAVQQLVITRITDWWPYIAAACVAILILSYLLIRQVLGPLQQLVLASQSEDSSIDRHLLLAPGEVGQIARNLDSLVQALRRSTNEQIQQQQAMDARQQRMLRMLQLGESLYATHDRDQLLARGATALRDILGYQSAMIGQSDDEYVALFHADRPEPERVPLSSLSAITQAALSGTLQHGNGTSAIRPGSAYSELAVPVTRDTRTRAVLLVQHEHAEPFTATDVQELGLLADLLAGALHA